jgi:galactokinase/mevalonate kinase-like predicted kinase
MTYYQHTIEEILAYFRITPEQSQKDIAKSIEIGKKHDGNVPAIFDELIASRDLTPIAKLLFAYSLGRTTKQIESTKEIESIIGKAIKKGMEIGASLPPGSGGNIVLSRDKTGITVEIQPSEESEEKPAIAKSANESEDRMYI